MQEVIRLVPPRALTLGALEAAWRDLEVRLNNLAQQHARLEGRDGATPTFRGHVDLGGNRLKNVGPTIDQSDAPNRKELQTHAMYVKNGAHVAERPIHARRGLRTGVPAVAGDDVVPLRQMKDAVAGLGSGTVTSVGLVLPSELTVTVSPIATAGDLTAIWATETANTIFAGPTSGGAATPTFRALVAADIPSGTAIAGDVTGTLAATTVAKINGVAYNADPLIQYALLAGRAGGQTLSGGTAASENLVLHSTAHPTKGALQLDDAVTFWPSTPTTGTTVTTWGPTLALNGVGQAVHKIAPTLTWTTPGTYFGMWFGGSMSVAVQPTNFNFHAALYADLASSSTTNGVIPWAPDLLLNAMTQTLSGAITASAPSSYISTDISSIATIKATGGATLNYNAAGSGLCSIYWASGVNADVGSTVHLGRLTAIWDKTGAGGGAGSVTIDAISSVYTKDKATFGGTVACVESEITPAAGKWCILDTGGANSAFGAVRIGDTTAPTQKLEVAGNAVVTGTATVSGTTKMLSMPLAMTTTDNVLALRMLDVSGTLTYNVANFLSLNTGISFKPSLVFTVAGSLPSFTTVSNGPTFTASGVAISGNSGNIGFGHGPTYNIAAGGSHTGIFDIGFQSTVVVGASVTVTLSRGFYATDAIVTGTLTTQVGVDIAALASGTNNYGVRSAVAASANNYFLLDTGGAQSSFAGKFTKYNNVTTAGAGMPSIVAVINQTAQGAAQSGTALWTPAAAGFYRIGVTLTQTQKATSSSTLGGAGGVKINYKTGDGATAKNQQVPFWIPGSTTATVINSATNTVGDTLIGSLVVYTDTTAVTFDCGWTSSGATPMQYALRIRVEAL